MLQRERDPPEPVAIAPPVETLKPWIGVAEILFAEGLYVLQQAAQIAARERREGDQNSAQFRASLTQAKFGIARPQRIFGLGSGDRMHVMSASKGVRGDLGEADRTDRAGFDEARQFSDCVFDRTDLSMRCT